MKTSLSIVIFLLLAGMAFAAPVKVYVHDYPPYYNSEGQGYVANIIKDAFSASGTDIAIGVLPINRAVASLIDGSIDAFSPGKVFVPPESQDKILSKDYFIVTVCIFYRGAAVKTLDELKGKRVGLIKGSVLKQTCIEKGIDIDESEDVTTIVKKFAMKRIDAAELAFPTALLLFQKFLPEEKKTVRYITEVNLPCAISVPKKDAALLDSFAKGLRTIAKSGKYLQDIESFYGAGNVPSFDLLPELGVSGGTSSFDANKFYEKKRNELGIIVN